MDIIIVCIILSLLMWLISLPFLKKRKKDFIDSLKGGIGMGFVYVIIVALFIICVRAVIFIYVKLFFAD